MPTENELKYVIATDTEKQFAAVARPLHIWQGYPTAVRGMTVRIRRVNDGNKDCYLFTYKNNVGSRVVEIETPIDLRDFNDLWNQCLVRMEKVRYKYGNPYKGWEVDFFKDHHNHTYFAMAECEMPEGQKQPNYIPTLVQQHLIYAVPAGDERFSSKMIADPRYAKKLLEEVRDKKTK